MGVRLSLADLRAALAVLEPLSHDFRVRIGMAVHSEYPDGDGLALFKAWCRSDAYSDRNARDRDREAQDSWRSFKPGPIGIGTLLHEAGLRGFKLAARSANGASASELESARRTKADQRAAQEAQYRERADHAAREAVRVWDEASEQGTSAYLTRKGVRGHGVRYLADSTLLVPVRNAAGELVNLQRIAPRRPSPEGEKRGLREKRFLPGGRKTTCWHMLGRPEGADVIAIAEGYATAATVHEATGLAVAVAFDAGNLAHVAKALASKYPNARLMIAGDDDRATEARTGTNPGREKARTAARAVRGLEVFPRQLPDDGTDWNDLHLASGLSAVREQIEHGLETLRGASRSSADAPTPPDAGEPNSGPRSALQGPPDRFVVDEEGVWYADLADEGRRKHVCGPLRAVALARDQSDNGAALVLRFDTRFRRERQWLMPLAMLAGDGAAYRAELPNQGFPCPVDPRRRALLTEYLRSRVEMTTELVRHVPRVGWVGRCYVLPDETLGVPSGERVIFHSEAGTEARFSCAGSLEQWKSTLARVCIGNSRLVFAVSVAFAGPLLHWAPGTSGGGWHYVGDTSSGKTTGLLVAASVWGRGSEHDSDSYMQKWRATTNGLEYLGEQHNDCTLVLDELGQIEPTEAGAAAYMLADGMGKVRAKAGGGLRHRPTWRLLSLSSGELTLDQHMESVGRKMKGGHEVRLISLPAEVIPGSTLETTHGFDTGHELSVWVKSQAANVYGHAGRHWLLLLTKHIESLESRVREHMDAFLARYTRDEMVGEVKRGARRFALAAAAGEMATEAGLTDWPAGEALRAAGDMLNAWVGTRLGGIGASDRALIVRDLCQWFSIYGDANFKRWGVKDSDHVPATSNMCGWRRDEAVETVGEGAPLVQRVWFVLAEPFRSVVCKGHNPRRCIEVLKAHDLIELEPSGRARHMAKPPGYAKSGVLVYRIRGAILSAAADE